MQKLQKRFLNHSKEDVKISLKNQSKAVSLSLIMFIYCIINVIKYIANRDGSYIDSANSIKINNKKAAINPISRNYDKAFML